ncbi:hypothetical protein V6N11_038423 [Hibiscus sabdariffa]|uniref:Protein FLX-like 1 n=1 Tax=Hibiscus sabdariffa TaxID=183260 RepID=A0ABR2SK77_9ROSI
MAVCVADKYVCTLHINNINPKDRSTIDQNGSIPNNIAIRGVGRLDWWSKVVKAKRRPNRSKEHFTLILKNDTLVMSGRNRGPPPIPMKGHPHAGLRPPVHEPPYARGLGPMPPHPALLDEMRETQFLMGPRGLPPHPAILEERLAVQLQEIQGLLADNQGLAATHVALKQELEAAQHELQQMSHYADSLRMEKDVQMREMYEKSVRLEADLRGLEAMRAELVKVNADIKQLSAVRQDLTGQVQVMSQDLARLTGELQQAPVLKAEIENLKQELQRARAAIEYEKKGYAENYEHGQVMEKKLISMARELEKLRAEIANTEKGSHAASSTGGNPAIGGYNANYVNPEAGYPGNSYPVNYGMNPIQGGMDVYPQYGPASGSRGAYDMQRAQGNR